MTHSLLDIRNVSIRFGGVVALADVSFSVGRAEVCGLIGPNGAGKTTLFNCISRLYQPTEGAISLDGVDVLALSVHRAAAVGVGRTFQNLALLDAMTARENILIGGHTQLTTGFLAGALATARVRSQERELHARADELIAEFGLGEVAETPAGDLTFATRKKIELARALLMKPKLLLLDEPAGGLNQQEVEDLALQILRIRERHRISVLLVEHHLNLVMRVSDRVIALNFGRKIAEGDARAVQDSPEVVAAYLGAPE